MRENKPRLFYLTEDHVTLLNNAYVDWYDCEFGAPCIDGKRPYGNSDVYQDMGELLDVIGDEEDFYHTDEQKTYLNRIHKETQIALQVILLSKSFQLGLYYKENEYDDRSWKLAIKEEDSEALGLTHPIKEVREYFEYKLKGKKK